MIKRSELKLMLSVVYCLKLEKRTKVFTKVINYKRKKNFVLQWRKKHEEKKEIKVKKEGTLEKI